MNNLTMAFRKLSSSLILSKENFMCCQSCGLAECLNIKKELTDLIGYCFYHNQDNDNKQKGGNFYLAFGTFNKRKNTNKKIGQIIINTLTKYNIKTSWDGDTNKRIEVVASSIKSIKEKQKC